MLMKIITASSELSGKTRKQKDAPDVQEAPAATGAVLIPNMSQALHVHTLK